ncbi:phosphate signaling complex protein PhoU [Lichenicola cladoniae]|uniref:Phosphate-specific transport system accessory protein PhoU n=1 Tax=Lichenicola cladoniae TaxID=1484109 RepID=A0A6M8HUM3_9PROT|nr:phosphate signaling complex protein PhoU [Lichenicola cladoniae]NPD66130.1 phosphate signaling complex protein PhoU [Acetobacteraceae bacterium]QKE92000.1 phosphate signaling complex protein PhoU [Lichenicola cladoniae]
MAPSEPGHIVKSYEQELNQLRTLMARMGGLVENQTAHAIAAILDHNAESAQMAMEQDPEVDALEREVEARAIKLLALRAPMAQDLREIVSALKVTSDLERIGDYAANVAKRSLRLGPASLDISLGGLRNMSRLVQESLRLAIDALGQNDKDKAIDVWRSDKAVDEMYTAMFRELVTYMMEDPRNIGACTHLLFIAKNLERIGDHATNIAERVHYAVTGEMLPFGRPRGGSSTTPEGAAS